MICTFFGHRDAPNHIKGSLRVEVLRLINEKGVKRFYIGNNGSFDYMAQSVLQEIAMAYEDVKYAIVLSAINECAMNGDQEHTIFPEGLECVPPKFAIPRKNDWLIKQCDVVVVYAKYHFSNSFKYAQKAARRGARIIYLPDA